MLISTVLCIKKAEAGARRPTDEDCLKIFMDVYLELDSSWFFSQGDLSDV